MRSILSILAVAVVGVGCCGQPAAFRAASATAAAPCAAPMAAPCAPAPVMAYAAPAPVAVEYRVGAAEVGKAALTIPANLVGCASNFLRCAVDALFPVPQPSAYAIFQAPTYAVPTQTAPSASTCK